MGSIPLPALAIKPPEQTNALDVLRAVTQLKGAQQQQQMQNVQLQQQQMALKDQQTLRQLFVKHQGNLDKVIQDAPQAGVSPQTIQGLQLHNIDVKTKTADLVSKQGANAAQQADLLQGAHDAVDKASPERKAAEYQIQLQGLQQRGVDVSGMPPQYPGDEQFKMMGAIVTGHKQQVEDAFKAAETAKNVAQGKEAEAAIPKNAAQTEEIKANTAKIQAELNFYKKSGLAPGVPLDAQEASDWMGKNPGKSVSDYMQFKAKLVPAFNFNLQNQGATGQPGQPSAIAKGIADGSIKWNDAVSPRTPMAVKTALLQEVKSINPNFKSSDFDIEKKVQEAFTSGNYSQQLNSINRAREHMGTFLQVAQAMDNGDVKLINKASNLFKTQFGSSAPGNLQIAKQAFASEVGKSFAGANVALADRQELEHAIDNASSWTQLRDAAKTADTLLEGAQKALKKTYESGMQSKPNFGEQNKPSGMIRARDQQGKLHEAPSGTPLPDGWKLEQ